MIDDIFWHFKPRKRISTPSGKAALTSNFRLVNGRNPPQNFIELLFYMFVLVDWFIQLIICFVVVLFLLYLYNVVFIHALLFIVCYACLLAIFYCLF